MNLPCSKCNYKFTVEDSLFDMSKHYEDHILGFETDIIELEDEIDELKGIVIALEEEE